MVRAILITDGKANTPLGKSIRDEIVTLAKAIKRNEIKVEIYDTRRRMVDPAPSYIDILTEILSCRVYRLNV